MRRTGIAMLASGLAALAVAGTTVGHPHRTARADPAASSYVAASDDRAVLVRLAADHRRAELARRVSSPQGGGGERQPRRLPTVGTRPPAVHVPARPGLAAWLARPETRKILRCESDGDYTLIDVNGGVPYRGAFQMDPDFLRTYAGISPSAYDRHGRFTLSPAAQNAAAYAGWLARGYQPWSCA